MISEKEKASLQGRDIPFRTDTQKAQFKRISLWRRFVTVASLWGITVNIAQTGVGRPFNCPLGGDLAVKVELIFLSLGRKT